MSNSFRFPEISLIVALSLSHAHPSPSSLKVVARNLMIACAGLRHMYVVTSWTLTAAAKLLMSVLVIGRVLCVLSMLALIGHSLFRSRNTVS